MREGERQVVAAQVHLKAQGLKDIIKQIDEQRPVSILTG